MRYGSNTQVRLSRDKAALRIDVEDDGPGIPDACKTAMLEAFVRGDEARTMDDRAGFGLGLSIARAIAAAHGGTLTLHDRVPHGLIARITLPAGATGPRIDLKPPRPTLAPFRGVPADRAEKNPLNLIRVMPAKGQGL